jgi:hypothetical protein
MKKVLTIILLAIAGSYGIASAQQTTVITSDTTGWYKIGEAKVDFKRDRDEIVVLGADKFKSIRLEIINSAIDLKDLEIHYEKGKKQDVNINKSLKAADGSGVIDLEDGGQRSIKKIVFVYKSKANIADENASLEVWGLKINPNKK